MEINELSNQAHKIALEKGFYDNYNSHHPRPITEFLMLIVTELAEACEADRNKNSKKSSCRTSFNKLSGIRKTWYF